MRSLILLPALSLLLTACNPHTLPGLRNRPPTFESDSNKTTEVLGTCLAAAVDRLNGVVSYVPAPRGATLTVQASAGLFGGDVPLALINIDDLGDRRHVVARLNVPVFKGPFPRVERDMKACL